MQNQKYFRFALTQNWKIKKYFRQSTASWSLKITRTLGKLLTDTSPFGKKTLKSYFQLP